MIAVRKLMTLSPLHRARKAAQVLGHLEAEYRAGSAARAPWVVELAAAFAGDEALPEALRALASELAGEGGRAALVDPVAGVRLVNRLARGLEAHEIGRAHV